MANVGAGVDADLEGGGGVLEATSPGAEGQVTVAADMVWVMGCP